MEVPLASLSALRHVGFFFELGDLSKLAEVALFTLAAVDPVTPLLR